MITKSTDESYLKICLNDCDFSKEASEQYIRYAKEDRTNDMLRLLNRQHKALMDKLHMAQRKVDAVDFMIRSLKNTGVNKNERNILSNLR